IENVQERHGMFHNVPRSLRRAVERRLERLQTDAGQFDRAALVHHARLKRLHPLLHIKPGDRARATLFGQPPPGSARAPLRGLAQTKDPDLAAVMVYEHRLPYLLVEAALGDMPAPVAEALVDVMDADELLARLPLLGRRGLLRGGVRTALLRRFAAV